MKIFINDNIKKQILFWMTTKTFNLRKKSQDCYRQAVWNFMLYLKNTLSINDRAPYVLTKRHIILWLKYLRSRYPISSIMPRVSIINNYLSFMKDADRLNLNPLGDLLKPYHKKKWKRLILALTDKSPEESLKQLKEPPPFNSAFGQHMINFVNLQHSLGKKYREQKYILCCFDRFLQSFPCQPELISRGVIHQWLTTYVDYNPQKLHRFFCVVRQFCIYQLRYDARTHVPEMIPKPKSSFKPHIYSREEIKSMLRIAAKLKADYCFPIRPQMFRFLLLLLYTTGMRIGEAMKLKLCDIDWQNGTLYIRESKFYKSRYVPLSNSMIKEFHNYLNLRQNTGAFTDSQAALFQNPHRQRAYSKIPMYRMLYKVLKQLGYKIKRGSSPRFHDLRHSFAVHRLENWYKSGADVQSKLRLLSTYLGHKDLTGTQKYLTMTVELLEQASMRFNNYYASLPGGLK